MDSGEGREDEDDDDLEEEDDDLAERLERGNVAIRETLSSEGVFQAPRRVSVVLGPFLFA
jgi:hypothetical protein